MTLLVMRSRGRHVKQTSAFAQMARAMYGFGVGAGRASRAFALFGSVAAYGRGDRSVARALTSLHPPCSDTGCEIHSSKSIARHRWLDAPER